MCCTNEHNGTGEMKSITLSMCDDFVLNNNAIGLMPDSLCDGVSYASLLNVVTLICLPSQSAEYNPIMTPGLCPYLRRLPPTMVHLSSYLR